MMQESSECMTDSEIVASLNSKFIFLFLYKQETASKSRQARDGKQESSSKSRQARVDKKETGGKQETAIDEKAENTVKECTNWKDKKKDKEQEALLISEDTAFVITGENIGPKPNPGKKDKLHGFYTSKSRQSRVDKKETGGKKETAIDEKAENKVKECTNWKDKKKDKEQEALDTTFMITGENIGPKPNPGNHNPLEKPAGPNDSYKTVT
ncbi:hypothetical protein Tco_0431168 [Tanacetum coccineum]